MNVPAIPALDPTPLPAPVWVFQVLLLVTFYVHILFLNVTLGGSVIGAVHASLARGKDAPGRRLGQLLAGLLPTSVSFTVTTGVAPLLFIQLMYGQLFYAATVLVGWIWLAILPLIVVGYYAVYLYKFEVGAPGGHPAWLSVAGLCFVTVAAIQVLVNVLQITPPRWEAVAATVGAIFQDPTLLPRYLHFLFGSLAVAGLFLTVVAVERAHRTPDPFFTWLARRGIVWSVAATGLQMVDGFWFLFSLPRDLLIALVGGKVMPTIHLAVGMMLGFLALILLSGLRDPERQRSLVRFTAGAMLAAVLAMVGLRDIVRGLYLGPIVRLRELPTQTQTDVTILFFLVFVLGLATVGWMVWRTLRDRRTPA
ncbi:MAG: hypothetical protein A2Z31_04370 [candidate division NC10 bacterium RBG_16_65_8]|nr:MAG: hypothetical protein A2Z31_04370 [candidate division NC10 bacterium RBG_16_65_8]